MQSFNFAYRIFIFEIKSFVINVEILDKNDILLAHIIPAGANPDIVKPDPTPNRTPPYKIFQTIKNTFFLFKLLYFFYNIHYQF